MKLKTMYILREIRAEPRRNWCAMASAGVAGSTTTDVCNMFEDTLLFAMAAMAGWLHGVFVGEWLFVSPLCGFSLSLFCNYSFV